MRTVPAGACGSAADRPVGTTHHAVELPRWGVPEAFKREGLHPMTRVKIVDNTAKVRRAAKLGGFKSLKHAGGGLRLAAQRLIRKRKTASAAGTPPNTRAGALKRSILFATEGDHTVVIGPAANLISDVAAAHEHGRAQEPRGLKGKTELQLLTQGTNYRLEVGGHGPIVKDGEVVHIKLRTTGQVQKSIDYMEGDDEGAVSHSGLHGAAAAAHARKFEADLKLRAMKRRVARSGRRRMQYPKRPFMGPTLMNNLDRIPAFWANSVN
jgi:hypothetical protein